MVEKQRGRKTSNHDCCREHYKSWLPAYAQPFVIGKINAILKMTVCSLGKRNSANVQNRMQEGGQDVPEHTWLSKSGL